MKLGIVYRNGRIINHRSFVKVVLNPVLRYFGLEIATLYSDKDNTLGRVILQKCERIQNIRWENYQCEYDFIAKKRLFY